MEDSMTDNLHNYDRVLGEGGVDEAPSSDHRTNKNGRAGLWIGMSIALGTFGFVCFMIWLAILLSRKARRSPFNWYACYLLLPNLLYAFSCAAISGFNACAAWNEEHYHSETRIDYSLRLYQFHTLWSWACNAWINALIVRQLHYLLNSNHRCIRYQPPTRRCATWQCATIYLVGALLAAWGASGYYPWFTSSHNTNHKHHHHDNELLVYRDLELTRPCLLFLWLIYLPVLVLVPCLYTIWIMILDVRINHRLPSKGQRRTISLYFFRIVTAYMILWTPAVVVYGTVGHPSVALTWTVLTLGHCHILVSALLVACKPDVYTALRDLGSCVCCKDKCCWRRGTSSSAAVRHHGKQHTASEKHQGGVGSVSTVTADTTSMIMGTKDDEQQQQQRRGCRRATASSITSCTMGDTEHVSSFMATGESQALRSGSIVRSPWTSRKGFWRGGGGDKERAAAAASAAATDAGEGVKTPNQEDDDDEADDHGGPVEVQLGDESSTLDREEQLELECVPQQADSFVEEELHDSAQEEEYEDVPRQSQLHFQFDDELDVNNPSDIIFHSIEEEQDESHLPVAPF